MDKDEAYRLDRILCECTMKIAGRTVSACLQTDAVTLPESPAGENIHSHPQYEVHYGGECGYDILLENNLFRLRPREILLIAPGVYHTGFSDVGNEKKRGFYYYFSTESKNSLISPIDFKEGCLTVRDDFGYSETFDRILVEWIEKKAGYSEKAACLFSCLFIDLSRALADCGVQNSSSLFPGKSRIGILDRFFTLQYNSNPRKTDLAERLSLSERQLERVLKETYGLTFTQKVQKTKFETANYFLRHLGYSSAAVAQLVGYSCENSFCAAYKKYFGITPSQFLRQTEHDMNL